MQIGRGEYRSWQMALPCVPLDCALYSVPAISSSCEPPRASLTSVHQGLVPSVDTIYAAKEQTLVAVWLLTQIPPPPCFSVYAGRRECLDLSIRREKFHVNL